MQVKIFSMVLLILLGGSCIAEIAIEIPQQSKLVSHLVNASARVLTSCYGGNVKEIGIHGDPTELLSGALLSEEMIPLIFIDKTREVKRDAKWGTSKYKLELFAIVANSTKQLQGILEKINNSPWWNHMASFLILNWRTNSDDTCSNAFDFLWAAWQMDLLNVNFLCVHETQKILLYTFNPYTVNAPDTWKLEKTSRGKHDHPWSIFVQEFREDRDICEGLDFDKTEDLGGWKIRSSAHQVDVFWQLNENKTGTDRFEGLEGLLWRILFRAMNANVELTWHGTDAIVIGTNNEGEITKGVVLDVIKKTSDILLNSYYQEVFMNLTVTHASWNGGIGVVTHHNGYLSQLSKVKSVIDISSRYGLCAVILTTVIFFKVFLREALITAILNTLRLACNSCLTRTPNTTATRIYLGALLFVQITIIGLYQGQLASLLTKEVEKKNINTMEELLESGKMLHGYKSLESYFKDPAFKDRFVGHEQGDCVKYPTLDKSAACVRGWNILTSQETPSELHLSSEKIIDSACVYGIRENWPLEKRVNEILGRMVAGGIIRRIFTKLSEKVSNINKFNKKMRINQGPRVLTLKQLSFAFAILGIGLGFAAAAFIVEFIVGRVYR